MTCVLTRTLLAGTFILSTFAVAQEQHRDTGVFIDHKNEFIDSVRVSVEKFLKKETPKPLEFFMDFSSVHAPDSVGQFKQYWHLPPVSQGLTGTCWSFSTTSYYESEIYRLTKRSIKLSEMYTVYW